MYIRIGDDTIIQYHTTCVNPPMLNLISFMSANFLARVQGYQLSGGWADGDRATNAYFASIETFAARFDRLLADVRAMGFAAIDLWSAHLNWMWATQEHVAIARAALERYDLRVASLAGNFGDNRNEFQAACQLANALNTTILGGSTSLLYTDRAFVVHCLVQHGLRLGIENHPEKNADEMLAKIGDGSNATIGTTIDTGCYATEGYDAAEAINRLAGHIVHVHLRDVVAVGGEDSCRLGKGVVPLKVCVQALQRIEYTGPLSIEHEPEHYDPTEDCKASLELVKQWLRRVR